MYKTAVYTRFMHARTNTLQTAKIIKSDTMQQHIDTQSM